MKLFRVAAMLLAMSPLAPARAAAPTEASDRAAIHALLIAYGATIDARDFDAFARLFTAHGRYVSGPGEGSDGGVAAAAQLKEIMAKNPFGFREPNFHVFFNEVVTLDGPDRAHATSMSFFVVPDAANQPHPALMARYEDDLVRDGGQWKFARRVVKSLIPAPPAAKAP